MDARSSAPEATTAIAKIGRPTKPTPEVQEEILRAIRAGAYPEVAAQRVGIVSSTFYKWMERGREARDAGQPDDFTEFSEAVEAAKGHAETKAVAVVLKAADKSWRAAAWWLERTRPQRYGQKQTLEHGGDPENPVTVNYVVRFADDRDADDDEPARPGNPALP